jgi:hypothetical protein
VDPLKLLHRLRFRALPTSLDYLRIEYLWHVLIMPPTNRNGISGFPSRPSDFEEIVEDVLGGIGDGTSRLKGSVERLRILVDEVRTLCTEERPIEH